ncbi:alpha/beta hydrolase fold-domain-containing protein [Xylariomycetidae sp. FL2044]|nr:alpha/beta hydrolase fold-domain-containing protein [Xylariomycetidae sp. FL2044]
MPANEDEKAPSRLSSAQLGLVWALLPKIPMIVRVILLHVLRISESSRYLDLRSDVTIATLRSLLTRSKPRPISKTQKLTLQDPGIKGRIWVSKVASEVPPEHGIRDALLEAIDTMKGNNHRTGDDSAGFRIPDVVPVEAEWTGYRAAAKPDSTLPAIPEDQKYREMMKECKNPITVLYFHGGAYYLCDPATHRPLTKKIAKLTGGRVYSIRYRLAPQHPFPAAILDGLVSYFTLLYPPPGSIHEAVSPRNIVFAGDSAGGNLSLALLQAVLQMRRLGRTIRWFGAEREVPLPAGVATHSPWLDVIQSMPSWASNARWDYLPRARLLSGQQPPADDIWPADPPRRHLYVDDAYLLHPLASLQLSASWAGAPPVYVSCGWECLADEDKYLAARLTRDGVPVVFEEYEAMPHVFVSVVPRTPEAARGLEGWSNFITAVCHGAQDRDQHEDEDEDQDSAATGAGGMMKKKTLIESSYTTIRARTLKEVDIDVAKITPFDERDVWDMAYAVLGRKASEPEIAVKL